MNTLTIPTTHSAEEARKVMNDTARLLRQDARLATPVTAKAAATVPPPSASDQYFGALERHLEAGKTTAQARRLVATHQRGLLDAYLAEFSASSRAKTQAKAEAAARERRRRNAR